jgi:glyoxylase I family protein
MLGFSHIDLTVTDLERSARWWQEVMGFALINHSTGATFSVANLQHPTGVVVSVMTHDEQPTREFDERRVGLDHLAFQVANRAELEQWVAHLDAKQVANSGVIDAPFGPTLVFRDPDNIQLELFVHPDPATVRGLLAQSQSSESGAR